MKDIISADWHIKNYSEVDIEDALFASLEHLAQKARELGASRIFCLGDVFNEKSYVHAYSGIKFKDFLKKNSDLEFILLSGNHDQTTKLSQRTENCLRFLEEISNVRIILEPTKIDNYWLVPWMKDIKEALSKGSGILLSHFGLNEALVNPGLSVRSPITLKDIEHYDLVLLGHYHLPQKPSDSVYYVGSLTSVDWNDLHQKKRFFLFDSDSLQEIEALNKIRFFELKASRDNLEEIIEEIEELRSQGHRARISLDFVPDDREKVLLAKENICVSSIPVSDSFKTLDLSSSEETRISEYLKIKEIKKENLKRYLDTFYKIKKRALSS